MVQGANFKIDKILFLLLLTWSNLAKVKNRRINGVYTFRIWSSEWLFKGKVLIRF